MTTAEAATPSPYVELERDAWRALRAGEPPILTEVELDGLRSLRDPIDLGEIEEIYLPMVRLLDLFITNDGRLRETIGTFLGEPVAPTPFVIGIAGSVAVGKSTTARVLHTLL